jgi:hypothetical protein
LNAPPYQPEQTVLCDFKHAPCPTTREEALGILYLLEAAHPDDEQLYWPGYTVAEPEALADLTAEDRAAWDAWVASDRTVEFLDQVIATCTKRVGANWKFPNSAGFTCSTWKGSGAVVETPSANFTSRTSLVHTTTDGAIFRFIDKSSPGTEWDASMAND